MQLPKHRCGLHLCHNEHKNYYQSVEEFVLGSLFDWKDEEAKQRAIATDEIWTLQWYPNTPVCCYCVAAPTLEELLEFANS